MRIEIFNQMGWGKYTFLQFSGYYAVIYREIGLEIEQFVGLSGRNSRQVIKEENNAISL